MSVMKKRLYIIRVSLLLVFWYFVYLSTYSFVPLFPSLLENILSYRGALFSEAISIFGLAQFGSLVGAVTVKFILDRIERKILLFATSFGWIIFVTMAIVGALTRNLFVMGLSLFMFFVVVASGWMYNVAYLITAESFPSIVRNTSYGLTDGVAHIGGVVGPLVILTILSYFGLIYGWFVFTFGIVIMASIILLSFPKLTGKRLEEANETKFG